MSIAKAIVQMELERNLQLQKAYGRALETLPNKSITTKLVNGHVYFYWVYRENGKVKNKYISAKDKDIGVLMIKVRKRRLMQEMLRHMKKEQREMERYLRFAKNI